MLQTGYTDEKCNRCVEATAVKANRYYLMSDHPLLPEESKEPSFSIFPSGPDGDYLEQDISLIRNGKSVVSLRLIPNKGIIHVFPKEDQGVFMCGLRRLLLGFQMLPSHACTK